MNNKPIFYTIALSIPFIALAALEGLLRIANYGQEYPLFVPAQAQQQYPQGYLQPNPDIVKRFFHDPALAPNVGPDTFLFSKQKPPNSKRIIVMGGSTAAGFPYGRFGSPTGMLHQLIKQHYPTQNIEVISVAMASINSYALLDFVDEVIDIKPDAVLIYAGHNEYLGVMGVGSNFATKGGHAANLIYLKLKDVRLFQLAQGVFYAIKSTLTDTSQTTEKHAKRTVMATVAKEKSIVYQSDLYHAGIAQFENNLNMLLTVFKEADVKVFLSSIASNEKDLAPFKSTDNAQTLQLLSNLKMLPSNMPQAQTDLLLNADPLSANLAYAIADLLVDSQASQALNLFKRARDLDELRFRGPSVFNDIIKKHASTFSNVIYVDSQAFLSGDSANGIIGKRQMLEHVHPTQRGYLLIGKAFFESLNNEAFFGAPRRLIALENMFENSPISVIDHVIAMEKIKTLTSDYPFTKTENLLQSSAIAGRLDSRASADFDTDFITTQYGTLTQNSTIKSIAQQRATDGNWVSTQTALIDELQRQQQWQRAAIAIGTLFDALPHETKSARAASLLFLRTNELSLALYYAHRAYQAEPLNANYGLTLAEILFKQAEAKQSLNILNQVISQHPDNAKAVAIKRMVEQSLD